MMVKRKRIILVAVLVIVICLSVMAGATYALFTGSSTVTTHLKAGELKVSFRRVADENSYKTVLNNDGYLEKESLPEFDFTAETTENVFGIQSGELAVPGSEYSAKMKITNNGDVAFVCKVKIVLGDVDEKLAKQLKVYFDGDAEGKALSEYATADNRVFIDNIVVTKTSAEQFFTIKVVFENITDSKANNDAMNQEVKFDLLVEAEQLITDPTQP